MVNVIEKTPTMYNVFENHFYKEGDVVKSQMAKDGNLCTRLINAIADYNLKESPDLTYKGVFNALKIEPHHRFLERLSLEETKKLLNKDVRYFFFCNHFKTQSQSEIRNLLDDEKLRGKIVNHFINMVKIDLVENGDGGLTSSYKNKINKVVLQGEEIFNENTDYLNKKELTTLINLDNFFLSYFYYKKDVGILKNYIEEKINNNDIENLFTRFDLVTKADKVIFHELHKFIDVMGEEDKKIIAKKLVKKDGGYALFDNEIYLFCEMFKLEPSFINKIENWVGNSFDKLFTEPFLTIISDVLKDEKEEYAKGDLFNASFDILSKMNNFYKKGNEFHRNRFISNVAKEAVRKIIKHGHEDLIKYDLMKMTTLTSYSEVQDFIIKEMQNKKRDNLFSQILFLKQDINKQLFAKIKNIVSKERKEEKMEESVEKSSLEALVDNIVFKNKENQLKI